MASLIEQLDGVDISALTEKLRTATLTVSTDGTANLRALDPRDLLGELGELLKSDNPFGLDPADVTKSVAGGLAKLDGLVQLPHLPLLGDVSSGLERLVGLLEDAAERLGAGGEVDLDALLPEIGGLDQFFEDVLGKAVDSWQPQIPEELTGVLSMLRTLASRNPAGGAELAQMLAPFVLGLNLKDLDGAGQKLGGLLGSVTSAGGDFGLIETEIRRIAASMREVVVSLETPGAVPGELSVRVGQIRGDFGLLVHNTLPGAAAKLALELDRIDASALATELRTRLAPLAAATAAPTFRLDVDLLEPLRAVATHIEGLSAEQLEQHFASVEAELAGFAQGNTGTELLTKSIDELFDIVVHTMREVPLRRMRQDLFDELNAIETRIRGFEGFEAPQFIAEKVRGIEEKIDGIDLSAIHDRVSGLAQQIQGIVDQFPINDIKAGAEQAGQALGDVVGEFTDALAGLSKEVDGIADKLKAVDFHHAGEAAIGLIAEAREKVEAVVGSDDVPDAAKAGIGVAAGTLKSFDFTVSINAPFNEVLDSVDVSLVTAPLDAVTARVRDALEKVSPAALVAELEGPFDQLMKEVERLRSDALRAALSQEFERLVSALDVLKPENLVAPLDAEFRKLTDAVRKAIDPAPLFAPLRALHKKLMELVELLDLEKLLGKILGKTSTIPQLLGGKMQGMLQNRLGGAGPVPNTDATNDLFEWGDFVRPLAAIVMQVRARVEKLSESLVREALELIEAPLKQLASLAQGGGGLMTQIADAVEGRYRALDLFASGGPGADLLVAFNEFQGAISSVALEGQAGVELNGHVGAMRVDLDAHASRNLSGEARARSAKVGGALAAPDLGHSLRRVGQHLQSLAPGGSLAGSAADAISKRIGSLFDLFDFSAIADELDTIGRRIMRKLEAFATQIAKAVLRIMNHALEAVLPITPFGMLARIKAGMARVRAEFTVLDPALLEKEVRDLVDALVDGLEMYSPAHLASQLNGLTDGVKRKLGELNPATLLGDLTLIDSVIDGFQALRPSVVLAPLMESTRELTATLNALLAIDLGASLRASMEALRAELEAVVAQVQAEFQALVEFLEGQAGGASVSVSL